jgi:amidohydrolase
MSADPYPQIKACEGEFIAIRRDLHAHPELAFNEHRTSDLIAQRLAAWGIPTLRGLGRTGVVGIIKCGNGARSIGLRADMDALPIAESSTFAHASTHSSRMHACGHDGHTAMLLAAAKYLASRGDFDGTVYVIFQPAEEGGAAGARAMIEDGLFERCPMDAIFGVHNWPGLRTGQFAIRSGSVFASGTKFRVVIRGKGGHAAMPHDSIDPVPLACQIVQAFQTITSRNKRPSDVAVISVTMIHAGDAPNVIPDICEIRGTVRTFTQDVLDMIEQRMRQISHATCEAFDAQCEFEFDRYYPATINHPKETEFAREVLLGYAGEANVFEFEPTMGSEDFSFYLLQKPGCYFLIGNGDGDHRSQGHGGGPCTLHNPSYDFNDQLIAVGGAMWVRLAKAWLTGHDRAQSSQSPVRAGT